MRQTQGFLLFGFALLVSAFGSSAFADLDSMRSRVPQIVALKDKGLIGEKADGLLGTVGNGTPQAMALVAAENKDRLSVYKTRAKSQGHDLPTFMKVMGTERIKQEPSGRFIQNAQGSWVKK